jgi:hypothetical protein
MLISERKLRSIVRQALLESLGGNLGASASSGESSPAVTSETVKGGGGYAYQIFSDGRVQMTAKGGKNLPAPVALNQKQAIAVAAEQVKLGNKSPVIAQIASGKLVPGAAAAPVTQVGPTPNIVIIGREDYFPLDRVLGLTDDESKAGILGSVVKQGHAFVIIVDPKTRLGHRYDFGRYKEAESCKDDRLLTQAAQAAGLGGALQGTGLHTMGITLYLGGNVPAQISQDGKKILNLPQFVKSVKKQHDAPGNVAVITVTDAAAARSYAESMKGKCYAYAIPGFGFMTAQDTMNCGVFVARVLAAGAPNPPLTIDESSLINTPDSMYQVAASAGYQTGVL